MFGYVNANRKELSEKNKKIYQSYYCGLCQALKRNYGARAQLMLNYDTTFLAILLSGLYEPEEKVDDFVCGIHPTKKKSSVKSEIMDYAASMNILLSYHKLMDDWKDEKKLFSKSALSALKRNYKKAAAKYPRQAMAVEQYLNKQHEAEDLQIENADAVAGLTGEMLGILFAYRDDEWSDELKVLGMFLGKFIYMMDAYEDTEKDRKKNGYNPLLKLQDEYGADYEKFIKLMMTSLMSECAKSFERLPIIKNADILRNILYSGVWTKYDYIQYKRRKKG